MDMLLADARIFIPHMGGREALFKHEAGSLGRYLLLNLIALLFASSRVAREDAGDWTVSLSICRCNNTSPRRHIITYYLHLWLKHTFKLQLHPLLSLPLAFHFIPLQRLLCNSVLQLRQLCSLYTSLSLSLFCRSILSFISRWKKWDLTAWEVFSRPIYYLVQFLSAYISYCSHAHIWRDLVKQ